MRLVPPPAPSVPLVETTDHGWIKVAGLRHWGEKSRLICGLKPEPGSHPVDSQDPQIYANAQTGMCQKCRSLLIVRQHGLGLRVGQTVKSREASMVLYGKITHFFLDEDGVPMCSLTRIYVGTPRDDIERDEWRQGTEHWHRTARLCIPWEKPKS